jgi:BRCA1/BRCA2-containing complex subunit 3
MGLLVGESLPAASGTVVRVAAAHILTRVDKRPDRCEISEIQLAEASAEADRLSAELGRTVRIVGWYHSHPHITVLPSHVDVRTQGSWQMMDSCFVGLIFSVFNEENDKGMRLQLTAFQAAEVQNPLGGSQTFEQVEVPIHVVGDGWPQEILGVRSPAYMVELVKTLYAEEESAMKQAMERAEEQASGNPLLGIFHRAVYDKCLAKLLEFGCLPLEQQFRGVLAANEVKLAMLKEEAAVLQAALNEI